MAHQPHLAVAWLACLSATACASYPVGAPLDPEPRSAPEVDDHNHDHDDQDVEFGLDSDDADHPSKVIRFDDETSSDGPEAALRAAPRRKAIPSMELFGTGRHGAGPVMTIPDDED